MEVSPYLLFNGYCEEAFKFYAELLGGKIESMMKNAGSPAEEYVSAEWRDKILHARMLIGNYALMASDAPPGRYEKPQGFSVSAQIKDANEGKRVFDALSADGSITMPFEKTFWAEGFGMCVDRFGIPWMVNCG